MCARAAFNTNNGAVDLGELVWMMSQQTAVMSANLALLQEKLTPSRKSATVPIYGIAEAGDESRDKNASGSSRSESPLRPPTPDMMVSAAVSESGRADRDAPAADEDRARVRLRRRSSKGPKSGRSGHSGRSGRSGQSTSSWQLAARSPSRSGRDGGDHASA